MATIELIDSLLGPLAPPEEGAGAGSKPEDDPVDPSLNEGSTLVMNGDPCTGSTSATSNAPLFWKPDEYLSGEERLLTNYLTTSKLI